MPITTLISICNKVVKITSLKLFICNKVVKITRLKLCIFSVQFSITINECLGKLLSGEHCISYTSRPPSQCALRGIVGG